MSNYSLPQPNPDRPLAAVTFKDEDEYAGEPYGPVGFVYHDQTEEERLGWRPFDPNRKPDPWFTRAQAAQLAADLGVEFQES